MKKIALILAALLTVCLFSSLAEGGEIIGQGGFSNLPPVVTPTPSSETRPVMALPDPSILLTKAGIVTYDDYPFNGKTFTVRQYDLPKIRDLFLQNFNAIAEKKNFTVEAADYIGTPAFMYTDGAGKTAFLMYDYSGCMLLMTEKGMDIRKYEYLSVDVGDIIQFGTYEQDNNKKNGKEPVEWLVLDVQDGSALLLSKYALDGKPYNRDDAKVTWETCTLRTWLNGEFYDAAFSPSEQARILTTEIDNSKSQGFSEYETKGGNDTRDRVFLLSCAEVRKYLNVTREDRDNTKSRTSPTPYAANQGVKESEWSFEKTSEGVGACSWWLRSPGYYQNGAATVSARGENGWTRVYSIEYGAVRPALWIDLAA